jgi:hypothetical protein
MSQHKHVHGGRRRLLQATGLAAAGWLTPVAEALARQAENAPQRRPAQSLILLWMDGGPSQLDTFDPHPGRSIGGPVTAIDTPIASVRVAAGLPRTAEQLDCALLVRNVVSREGDHERATYQVKTGYRPDPTVVHPSIGAICCHQLPAAATEIPRHVSILPGRWPGRGGLLGSQYDAFKTGDPARPVPDAMSSVVDQRYAARLADLDVVDRAFRQGRSLQVDATQHRQLVDAARRMMTSEQLRAFDVSDEPAAVRQAYGDSAFGRGCLAARRLIEVGVRCVEVTLRGWDTHADNHEGQRKQLETLDPALAALLAELRQRQWLDSTVVVCCGEFGRTPHINRLDGRDHWPHGFSVLLAGGRLRRGAVVGQTDPEGGQISPEQGTSVADLHATILTALGIDPHDEVLASVGRPIRFSEGQALPELLDPDV